ncbi:MAG: hypothetical protein KKB34_18665 [Bacteroidetes bacterium]|nr:hypothetical protein [Bacteroidota bacterium]
MTDYRYGVDSLFNKFARPSICSEYLREYRHDYSDTTKQAVLKEVEKKIDSLSLDYDNFMKCFEATGLQSDSINVITAFVEKAWFNDEEVWNISAAYGRIGDQFKLYDIASYSVDADNYSVFEIQDHLPLAPEVNITSEEYDSTSIMSRYAYTDIWNQFKQQYYHSCTFKTRDKVLESISEQLAQLNIQQSEMDSCFNSVGELHEWSVPCLIEKIKYNGIDSWIILYLLGGFEDLSHIRYYVIDSNSYEILHEDGCL